MVKTKVSAVVAALVLAAGGLALAPAAMAAGAPKISEANAQTLKDAQDAMGKGNWAVVISKADQALANAKKTPDDVYTAWYFKMKAYEAQKNAPKVIETLQGQVDSGFLAPNEQGTYLKAIAQMHYQQRDYNKAIEYGERLAKNGVNDPDVNTLVGQSYYLQKKYGEAARFLNGVVTDQEKRGQKPREQPLQLLRQSYDNLGNKDAAQDVLEKLVVHYPKPEYWDNLLYSLRRDPKLNERQTLQVYRLMQDTKTLRRGEDYSEMSDIALDAGMPGEAYRVLDEGLNAKAFKDDQSIARGTRLRDSAKKHADTDRAALAKLEADAKASGDAALDVSVGMSYFGYGEYGKAIEALSRGLAKGSALPNASQAQLTLGIAQLRSKNNAEAIKTFRAIKTDDALMQRIVRLWTLHAQ